jgi:hypothetical protein
VVLKVLAHTGNDNFVTVITEICVLAVGIPSAYSRISANLRRESKIKMSGKSNCFRA